MAKTTKKIIVDEKPVEESKELIVAKQTVPTIVSNSVSLSVENEASKIKATEMLTELNQWNDRVVADRETLTVPLNALLKNIRGRYSPLETMLKGAIDGLRGKLGGYQTECVNKAREEEARIAARVGEGKGKLKIETASKQMEAIERASEKVVVESGSISFREDKVLRILDIAMIPFGYYDLNKTRALDDLKKGVNVPGCEIELVQVPINRR
jgi:hypothetical protein